MQGQLGKTRLYTKVGTSLVGRRILQKKCENKKHKCDHNPMMKYI